MSSLYALPSAMQANFYISSNYFQTPAKSGFSAAGRRPGRSGGLILSLELSGGSFDFSRKAESMPIGEKKNASRGETGSVW